jgi:hypothetical protein
MPNITARQEEYTDLDLIFTVNPNIKDVPTKRGVNAVRQSVMNILNTNWGERPFKPYFGANLRSYLFENMNNITAAAMSSAIRMAITNYEPRVKIINVNIRTKPEDNAVDITLTVQIISTTDIFDISTSLERLR